MRKLLLIALGAVLLMGCGGGKQDCSYKLHNDLTGTTEEIAEFPANVSTPAWAEYGDGGLAVAIADPQQPYRDVSVIVPACKRDEALAIIKARQEADKEQEAQGIPFGQRNYP